METRKWKQGEQHQTALSPGADDAGSSSAWMISENRMKPNSTSSQVKGEMIPGSKTLAFQSDCTDEKCSKRAAEFHALRARKITGLPPRVPPHELDDTSDQEREETKCFSSRRKNEHTGRNRRSRRMRGVCCCFSGNCGNDDSDDSESGSEVCAKSRDEQRHQRHAKETSAQNRKDDSSAHVVRKDNPAHVPPVPKEHARHNYRETKDTRQDDLLPKHGAHDDRKKSGSVLKHPLHVSPQPQLPREATCGCKTDTDPALETELCGCSNHFSAERQVNASHSILLSSPRSRRKEYVSRHTLSRPEVKRVTFREESDILSYTSSGSALDTLDKGCCGKS